MKFVSEGGLNKTYRHIFSLILSMIILIVDTVTMESSIETFNDMVTTVMAFFIAGLIYYGMVRVIVEILNFVGK
ncbi:hypothetical protein [Oceanobacillus sp. FSL H7-0719]|uniref:hypothetical protein n=1 Tax=Oceanobacillus sp. FSL H7-0719 TaxID=2954507 RepID=UPI00325104A2